MPPLTTMTDTTPARDATVWRAEFYVEVALLIQRRRKVLDMTQDEVAHELGISRASYANIEAARQSVSVDKLWKLAVVLGTDVSKLIPAPVAR